jgi:hypothetical protein
MSLEWKQIIRIFLEGLSKTTRSISQDIQSPSLDSNPGPPEYEGGVLDPDNDFQSLLLWMFS